MRIAFRIAVSRNVLRGLGAKMRTCHAMAGYDAWSNLQIHIFLAMSQSQTGALENLSAKIPSRLPQTKRQNQSAT